MLAGFETIETGFLLAVHLQIVLPEFSDTMWYQITKLMASENSLTAWVLGGLINKSDTGIRTACWQAKKMSIYFNTIKISVVWKHFGAENNFSFSGDSIAIFLRRVVKDNVF